MEPVETTTDAMEALQRLAAHLNWTVTKPKGAQRVVIGCERAGDFSPSHPLGALAMLAAFAMMAPTSMTPKDIGDVCGWNGIIVERGLRGGQYEVLAKLKDAHGTEWRNVR